MVFPGWAKFMSTDTVILKGTFLNYTFKVQEWTFQNFNLSVWKTFTTEADAESAGLQLWK